MCSLSEAIKEFLLAKEIAGRSKRTLEKYSMVLEGLKSSFLDAEKDLPEVSPHDIRLYMAQFRKSGCSPNTLDTYYRALNTFFTWASREYEVRNPMERIDKPRVPKVIPKRLSDNDVAKLLEACTGSREAIRDRAIVLLLVDTGIRAGELVNLKVGDIDFEKREIVVMGKDRKERIVPFAESASRALSDYLGTSADKNAPAFRSRRTGQALTVSGLRQILKRLAKRAGVQDRVYTHLFRHTFAHSWMEGGGDIETLQVALGHKSVKTTMIYSLSTVEDVKKKHHKLSPGDKIAAAQQLSLW